MEKAGRSEASFPQGTLINILRQSILFILLWLIFRKVLSVGQLISFQLIPSRFSARCNSSEGHPELPRGRGLVAGVRPAPCRRRSRGRPDEPVEIGEIERLLEFEDVVFALPGAAERDRPSLFESRLGDPSLSPVRRGSGKSTLVKLLVGLYAPSSGVVSVDGVPINELRYNGIRRQITSSRRIRSSSPARSARTCNS